jgi:hypothetical protein
MDERYKIAAQNLLNNKNNTRYGVKARRSGNLEQVRDRILAGLFVVGFIISLGLAGRSDYESEKAMQHGNVEYAEQYISPEIKKQAEADFMAAFYSVDNIKELKQDLFDEYTNMREIITNYSTASKDDKNKALLTTVAEYDKFKKEYATKSFDTLSKDELILESYNLTVLKLNVLGQEAAQVKSLDQTKISNENYKAEMIQRRINSEKENLNYIGDMAYKLYKQNNVIDEDTNGMQR